MLYLASPGMAKPQARAIISGLLDSGRALEQFRRMVEAQGGDPRIVDREDLLPQSRQRHILAARQQGFLAAVNARSLGIASMHLSGEAKDPSTGMRVHKKIGDRIEKGEPLCTVHYNRPEALAQALPLLEESFRIRSGKANPPPLIKQVIEND
jgi:thymidine phosphorylase